VREHLTRLKITGLLYKEFRLLIRKKRAPLLVLLLPLVLSLIYTATVNALSGPQTAMNVGVCNYDNSLSVQDMLNSLRDRFNLVVVSSNDCLNQLKSLIKQGSVLIGFEVPANFTNQLSNAKQAVLTYYVDESEPALASIASLVLNNALINYKSSVLAESESDLHEMAGEARARLDEITTLLNITLVSVEANKVLLGLAYPLLSNYLKDLSSKLTSYDNRIAFIQNLKVDFLVNPLLLRQGTIYGLTNTYGFNFGITFCIVSLFTLLLLGSTGYLFDEKNNYLLRLRVTKTPIPLYLFSKVILYLCISIFQFVIIMLLMLLQGAVFYFDFSALISTFILITVINTMLGLLIGLFAKTENIAVLTSLLLTLPFLFLSGSLVPLEFMPGYLQFIANIFPLRMESALLKQVSVLGLTQSPLFNYLMVYAIVLFVINYFLMKFKSD